MGKRARAMVVVLLATAFADGATAANLVTNGELDADVAGWAPLNGNIQVDWSALDPADPTASGSIRVRSVVTNFTSPGAIQCVDLPGDGPLMARAEVLVPVQSRGTGGLFVAYFYEGEACDGTFLAALNSTFIGEQADWATLTWNPDTPAGSGSVRFYLALLKDGDPAPAEVYFDGVSLPEPAHAALGIASFAAIALVRRRRR